MAAQLSDADRVQEIYQNMLPAWESTKEDDRRYNLRKQGLEAMWAYLDGTYSVFGLENRCKCQWHKQARFGSNIPH